MFDALMLGSGAFWALAYVLIIRRGFLDATYGMPLVALCANVSWEFIFSFVHPHGPVQRPVNIVWFLLDLDHPAPAAEVRPTRVRRLLEGCVLRDVRASARDQLLYRLVRHVRVRRLGRGLLGLRPEPANVGALHRDALCEEIASRVVYPYRHL